MSKGGKKLDRERKTIAAMIHIYCRGNHDSSVDELCSDCGELLDYANERLDKCPFADDKPTCAQCTIHCYRPDMRQKAREAMKYAGPRMIKKHPLLAVDHLVKSLKHKHKSKREG